MLIQYEYGDPGGKAALLPVLDLLEKDGVDLIQQPSMRSHANLLITSTSDGVYTKEKALTKQAREYGIPSLSVLDYWSKYRQRYANNNDDLIYLPDKIAVMDEYAKGEMTALGFNPGIIEVTGHPAFDCLADVRELYDRSFSWPYSRRYAARRAYGYSTDARIIIFVSQPIAEFGYNWGYTEHTVIKLMLDAIADIGYECNILIRPHPRGHHRELFKYEGYRHLQVNIRRHDLVHELMMGADLVVGMNSVMLVEACYLGCPVLSIQPGKIGPDRLPTNRLGISRAVYEPEYVKPTIETLLNDEKERKKMTDRLAYFKITEKAAPKVVDLVYRMVNHG